MTEQDLKLYKNQISSYKGQVTNFNKYVDQIKALDASGARELELRISKIKSLYDKFDEAQLKLECYGDAMDEQLKNRETFELLYFPSLTQAQGFLDTYNSENVKKEHSEYDYCSNRSGRKQKLVKLPTIQLPKFSGSYHNWLEFKDTFSSLIHNNEDIETINKFHYLRSSLEGSAAVQLQSVEFSEINYKLAWDLLCDRYDNKRLLIQNHMNSLFNIEPITKESSVHFKELIDQINKNLRSLDSLGEPVKHWDTVLIYFMTKKLDPKSFREWEEFKGRLNKNESIKFNVFLDFLRSRADLIETLELSLAQSTHKNDISISNKSNSNIKSMVTVQNSNSVTISCPLCNGNHLLNDCNKFLGMSSEDRRQSLSNIKICHNCFRPGHYANTCWKLGCNICKRKHNTLIHPASQNGNEPSSSSDADHKDFNPISVSLAACVRTESASGDVLLSTALIQVYDAQNHAHIVRAVLDSGSTSCLITNRLCEQLNLDTVAVDKSIQGINNAQSHIGKFCRVRMSSLNDSYSNCLSCFVLPSITGNVPSNRINIKNTMIPSNICLADPKFFEPSSVDIIIGADIFWDVLGTQKICLGLGQPTLFETRLGWLVSGPISSSYLSHPKNVYCNFGKVDTQSDSENGFNKIQHQLAQFWKLEEVPCKNLSHYSSEEKRCEEHFVKNTIRLESGRFCVRIPLKESVDLLGDSLLRAKRCLISLERRSDKQPLLYGMYKKFMAEYLSLGHMTECTVDPSLKGYFIPHHGILRENSATTKLRVVFNASSSTSSGVSFNNIQMVGPTVQDDLFSILLRFRFYKYVLSADVEKMYRQVAVHSEDRPLQQIVWRDSVTCPVKTFQLNTVTYGTASAPFLATRCLKQLGLDCEDEKIGKIIIHDFYVDDLLSGGDDLDEVQDIRRKVTDILSSACMSLHKWKSNNPILSSHGLAPSVDLNIGCSESGKTLGLGWQTNLDFLYFPIKTPESHVNSKRDLLSVIAQIFDPLGLLAPCIITMKMVLQGLWLRKLSWDEQLPEELSKHWSSIVSNLPALAKLEIPRLIVCDNYKFLDLHIYSDASERAYGACIYVRSVNDEGNVLVRLLVAKSRVAPIKPTTIPRLELCGALLGVRLYQKVKSSLRTPVRNTIFWTDSTIILGWLKMLPSRLHPFVRNRVAEILEATETCTWRHVPTSENPADLISRGVQPQLMETLSLWWSGPSFLDQDPSLWPSSSVTYETLPETRTEVSLHVNLIKSRLEFDRFSNYLRLQRSVAYVLRFVDNFIIKNKCFRSGNLTSSEIDNALNYIIRIVQNESFTEYQLLINKQKLPNKNPLLKLNVFMDVNNIMRVGGRLNNSNFTYNKKFPILLQSTHYFTKLLFNFEHRRLLHAGPQLLLATIRETYWPLGGRNLAKITYHRCVKCCRISGQVASPQMGNLPPHRVLTGTYPFCNVGIDYAGPIQSISRQGRGSRIVKVYIAIFICLATKCMHLELVGDLTSSCFLLALRRFISRRGKPTNIYSDNGTSFVGAYNELSKFLKDNYASLSNDAANDKINFHFIPAYAPHFGGLWEAGVKSTKYHLVRVLGQCNLTYEELNTTLIQIEAVLNSRPLTPISSEPVDLTPLTPGHFIIGRPLISLPEKDVSEHSYSHLSRFHRIEQLRQHFWERWSKEYISELQLRIKWQTTKTSLKLNTMVLIKEDHLPPLKWKLGRIVALHPGTDGISRVADIRVADGSIVRRVFSKICPLPEEDEKSG